MEESIIEQRDPPVSDLLETRKELMEQYYESMSALAELNTQNMCKLGVSDGKLYRSWHWVSGIQRNFRGESRKTTLDHISNCVTDVNAVYDSIFNSLMEPLNQDFETRTGNASILVKAKKNMLLWRNGLETLAVLYKGDEDTIDTIAGINAELSIRIERSFSVSYA